MRPPHVRRPAVAVLIVAAVILMGSLTGSGILQPASGSGAAMVSMAGMGAAAGELDAGGAQKTSVAPGLPLTAELAPSCTGCAPGPVHACIAVFMVAVALIAASRELGRVRRRHSSAAVRVSAPLVALISIPFWCVQPLSQLSVFRV